MANAEEAASEANTTTFEVGNCHTETSPVPESVVSSEHRSPSSEPTSSIPTKTPAKAAKMNPLAAMFRPRTPQESGFTPPPRPVASPLYELRITHDRGLGLFATAPIPRGTLIICEEPLLRIPTNHDLAQVWAPYNDLTDERKATFDGLRSIEDLPFDLEHLSRAYLANHVDTALPNGDIASEIANHVRIMKIFAANQFHLPRDGLAVYATAARINHSCVPNVQHSYNPTLGGITIYAVRDIAPNEELTITYIGEGSTYQPAAERNALLRSAYGFMCQCSTCADPTGTSDWRRLFMKNLAWGLSQYNNGLIVPNPFIPTNPVAALKQAEDHISTMMEEGIMTTDLGKAFRMASSAALNMGDLDRALEYARDEAVIERNCLGTQIVDRRKAGDATETWLDFVYDTIRAERGADAVIMYRGAVRGEKKNKKRSRYNRAKKAKIDEANNGQRETSSDVEEQ